ncbi:putative aldo-keto reductase putative protein [Lasiodiplodia theobromae]|uniref:Aldo-keto reductase yakc (NADP(+)) n=1 Tax=Lasiodiplodia theobromae TaxID=45133 RepID=A0A5N5D752_9PEZI|nr:Aldo-keto reductase [Lasiodiplodia theobromae]KAB2573613.1 Aldo-keto reductase yakc (NADP(+)) [Lasiodiplodia theobromae]KAF4542040.1 Aldo-keto reductase [Lasiodiplodia theobromae]KAF9628958.1 putative aldo-keto reductase putative protein [Lasiodiplodia theobromae]
MSPPSSIPTRKLGKNGPQVPAIGLGLMGLSIFYGPVASEEERLAFLDKAYELGQTNWDSSDFYGDNEDLLGKWFARNPDKRPHIFLATKFGFVAQPGGPPKIDSSPAYVRTALEKSLQRLGLPSVDLYYCHRLDGVTPVEKTMQALVELKNEGKIKYIGLSECSAASLRRACAVAHVDAVQIEYSPFSLDIEDPRIGLLAACRELGVATVAYSPLGRGMLSGKIRSPDSLEAGDLRRMLPRFTAENWPKNLALVDKIEQLAQEKGVTATQLTLAWLLAQGDDIIPIPGTTKVDRVMENLEAAKVVLTKEDVERVRKACDEATIHGGRYPDAMAAMMFIDTPEL